MYTLDTNVIIYYLNRDPAVVNMLDDLFENPDAVFYVSTVTEIELYSYPELSEEEEAGITRLFTDMFVVPVDSRIARYAGYIRRLYRTKTPDAVIATTAILTKTTLLTRNIDDSKDIDGLKLQVV